MNTLLHGDCLELLQKLPANSVDLVLCDLPYGTTSNAWDTVIPWIPLWSEYKRVSKINAAFVLNASQPFTTEMINSNRKDFRYCLVWDKTKGGNFANARRQPMKSHEDICVFYRAQPTYNPQMETRGRVRKKGGGKASENFSGLTPVVSFNNTYYPKSILQFSTGSRSDHHHPTQKPVELLTHLVRTYSNPGDTVLDNCMGSGSTGVACALTGRKFIGIELNTAYFEIAKQRITCTPTTP